MTHLIVGGAGIGGLTAAIALTQIGVDVTVLERRAVLGEAGAGLQLAPNASRILETLGVMEKLRPIAGRVEAIRIRRGRDGAVLTTLPLGAGAERRYGAPFLVIHRADLQAILLEHLSSGFDIRLGVTVVSHDQNERSLSLALASLEGAATLRADGFVDARGLHARRDERPHRISGRVAWRSLVPAGAVSAAFAKPETSLWLGPHTHLVHYPLRGGSCINVVAITEDDGGRSREGGDVWSEPGDPDQLFHAFRGWHQDATTLLRSAPEWQRWRLADRSPKGPWTIGRSTRLGDAAHPMLPFLAQGAGQAIEDAEGLAAAIQQAGTVEHAFSLYEKRRRARATRVQRVSRRQGDIYHLSRPASDARDLAMRVIGGSRALAGLDWLYAANDSTRR